MSQIQVSIDGKKTEISYFQLMEIIKKSVGNLADELSSYFPEIKEIRYSNDSLASVNGNDFVNRLSMGIHIELMRAGLLE